MKAFRLIGFQPLLLFLIIEIYSNIRNPKKPMKPNIPVSIRMARYVLWIKEFAV